MKEKLAFSDQYFKVIIIKIVQCVNMNTLETNEKIKSLSKETESLRKKKRTKKSQKEISEEKTAIIKI